MLIESIFLSVALLAPIWFLSSSNSLNELKLWAENAARKRAQRDTSGVGNIKQGAFSPNAKKALTARHEQQCNRAPKPDIGENTPYMRHRLRRCLSFWKTFCTSTLVLSWIEYGFPLRWIADPPPPTLMSNHKSAFENSDIITSNIFKLVNSGVLQPMDQQPYLVSPLGVVFKRSNNKPRMILDARFLNGYIQVPSFKYEDLGFCHQYMQPGDYLLVTDYTSGYHHVDLHPEFWQYFGIEWDGHFYVFTSLPFGLASACWAFTKIGRELLNKWRRSGHRCSGFIDDNIHCGTFFGLKSFARDTLIPDTERSGFLFNSKSDFEPKTRQVYLGMFVDTIRRCFEVPQAKRDILISLLQQSLANHRHCSVHLLEKLAGNLASMHWTFGPLSRLMTMSLYDNMKSASSIDTPIYNFHPLASRILI